MVIFNGYVANYQRVPEVCSMSLGDFSDHPLDPLESSFHLGLVDVRLGLMWGDVT